MSRSIAREIRRESRARGCQVSEPKEKKMIPIPEPPIIPKKEMSEPTREEILREFAQCVNARIVDMNDKDMGGDESFRRNREVHEAIRKLLERPTVSRVKLNELLHFQNVKGEVGQRYVIMWLAEHNIEVEP